MLFVGFVNFVPNFVSAQEPSQNRREFTIVAKDHVFTPDKLDVDALFTDNPDKFPRK